MTLIELGRIRRDRSGQPTERSDRKSLLYEEVIELVERLVVERRLAPGDLLPTQAELCELAGVSRITVTRALAELEREGRVQTTPGSRDLPRPAAHHLRAGARRQPARHIVERVPPGSGSGPRCST